VGVFRCVLVAVPLRISFNVLLTFKVGEDAAPTREENTRVTAQRMGAGITPGHPYPAGKFTEVLRALRVPCYVGEMKSNSRTEQQPARIRKVPKSISQRTVIEDGTNWGTAIAMGFFHVGGDRSAVSSYLEAFFVAMFRGGVSERLGHRMPITVADTHRGDKR